MPDAFSRMEMLLGDAGADKLGKARIAVFGLGGAGSFAAEALARCGVASLHLWIMGSCLLLTLTDSYMRCDLLLEKVMFRLPR